MQSNQNQLYKSFRLEEPVLTILGLKYKLQYQKNDNNAAKCTFD